MEHDVAMRAGWTTAAVISLTLCAGPAIGSAGVTVLDYNVNGIGPAGSDGREALQRIVDYFDPDVILFQEAKGTTYPQEFLQANSDYEGFYSSADGAGNRRMILSKYDIVDASVREHELGEGSLRTLFAATIDLPGPRDLEVFTAHWHASSASVRANESAASVAILQAFRASHPGSFYVYAGDFNDEDTSSRITDLLNPSVGLTLFTPVDPNNGSSATINSDPAKGTYLDRRVDYILPSDAAASCGISGRVLNTWSYPPGAVPPPLQPADTIAASDHLPVYACLDIPAAPLPGDTNDDNCVDGLDYNTWSLHYRQTGHPAWSDGGWTVGNFNADETVDGLDYNVWSLNYQAGCEGAAIPEPAFAALFIAGLGAVLRRRTNR
jgi:endonuclease/exonuclease/phosphatase family metal-dependent hydrolase